MRKLPQGLPAINELAAQPQEPRITQRREYRIITALFGGGVEPSKADPITVVRATEVRGHLRFWWRATRGGQYGSLKDLKAAEDAIWGAAATKDEKGKQVGQSAVWVEVVQWSEGKKDTPYKVIGGKPKPRDGSAIPDYVAFPLQPTEQEIQDHRGNPPLRSVFTGVTFQILINYQTTVCIGNKDIPTKPEVEAALWAWETFGGIGARTRRGFGALQLVSVDNQVVRLPTVRDVQHDIQKKLEQHVVTGTWPDHVPHLQRSISGDWFVLKKSGDPYTVWQNLSDRLKEFRQQRRDKNTRQSNKYGHSDWPEPNAIRRKAGVSARGPHAARKIDAAPRGAFGLPIVFHMAHDSGLDQTLQIDDKQDRFASPLILKPIACRREGDNDRAIGLALILQGTEVPDGLYLKGVNQPITRKLTQAEAKHIPVLKGETDVLKAFLRFL